MKITKYGHCCLLIEEAGVRILTDPGSFTTEQSTVRNIDIILITHEHQDHLHIDSVKKLVANNPKAVLITNASVGKVLDTQGIKFQIVADKQKASVKDILIEGFGTDHAIIYKDYGLVENTGYFINNKLFYPGDAFTNPGKPIEVLALPAGGPWLLVSRAVDYAKELKPKSCFPVHDGMIIPSGHFALQIFQVFLGQANINFVRIENNKETEF